MRYFLYNFPHERKGSCGVNSRYVSSKILFTRLAINSPRSRCGCFKNNHVWGGTVLFILPVEFLLLSVGLCALLGPPRGCLLYTSDAADERSSVDLGGRRIIKKK